MSLGTMTRSLVRAAKKRFPGAADAHIRKLILLQVDTALDHPSNKVPDEDLLKFADAALTEAVEAGEEWAVALENSVRDHIVKPLVDKAREKGVDPVPVIVMQTDLTEAQVTAMIEALDAEAARSDDDMTADLAQFDGTSTADTVPATGELATL